MSGFLGLDLGDPVIWACIVVGILLIIVMAWDSWTTR